MCLPFSHDILYFLWFYVTAFRLTCCLKALHQCFCATSLSGMKVYTTDEKELIMEPRLKFAGNPNVTVAVKAFGLKATAQVIELFYADENKFNI